MKKPTVVNSCDWTWQEGAPGIVYLYGEIGKEVNGHSIAETIQMWQQYGCCELEVRINSIGGDVVMGWSLYSAIANFKGRTTCFVDGLAASAAAWILQAGQTRKVASNALLMIHNPSASGQDTDVMLGYFRESIISMLSAKCSKTSQEVGAMMDAESWLNASEAVSAGFADEVFDPLAEVELDACEEGGYVAEDVFNRFALVLNRAAVETGNQQTINNQTIMNKEVRNALSLSDTAQDSEVVQAINALVAEKAGLEQEVKTNRELLEKAKTALDEAQKVRVINILEAAAKEGKIVKEGDAYPAPLVAIGMADEGHLNAVLAAIPVNKAGQKLPTGDQGNGYEKLTAAGVMAEIQNKLQTTK